MQHTWSIITVTYNSADSLRTYWSTQRMPADVEWIVVDNASTDDSVAVAEDLAATRIIHLPNNMGFSRANNIGAKAATGNFLLFANPDLGINYNDLDKLEASLIRQEGIVCPQLLNPDRTIQPNGRGLPTITNKIANRLRDYEGNYYITCDPGQTRFACFGIGAAIAMRESFFGHVGGWNERFFVYYEDSDICLRAWRHGTVRVTGDVRWIHGWRRETKTISVRAWKHELSSARRFYSMYPQMITSGLPQAAPHRRMLALLGRTAA